jgi:hypothetical protein
MADESSAAILQRDGVVRLRGVIDGARLAAMRARVWRVLATRGIEREDRATWRAGGALPLVELAGALRPGPGTDELLWEIGRDEVFAELGPTVERAVAAAQGAATWVSVDAPSGGLAAPNLPLGDVRGVAGAARGVACRRADGARAGRRVGAARVRVSRGRRRGRRRDGGDRGIASAAARRWPTSWPRRTACSPPTRRWRRWCSATRGSRR